MQIVRHSVIAIVAAVSFAATASAQIVHLSAALAGEQEVPAATSTARGFGIVRVDQATNAVRIFVHQEGIAAPTAAHLHLAPAGTNGGILVPLAGGPADFTGTATLSPAQVIAVLGDGTYLNVHSAAFPGGEIRGQVTASTTTAFACLLSGANEVPPNNSAGNGQVTAMLHEPDNRLVYQGYVSVPVLGAALHLGASGTNGPVIEALRGSSGGYVGVTSPLTLAQVAALKSGNVYVNVHSASFPGGELRGQMVPDAGSFFVVAMDGASVAPPTASAGFGGGYVQIAPDGTATVAFHFSGLASADTAAHLHVGAVGSNGAAIVSLGNVAPGWYSAQFTPSPAQLTALRAGGLYVDIDTVGFPGGEIRGQVTPARLPTTFGGGCLGANLQRPEIAAPYFPVLGWGFQTDLYGIGPLQFVVHALGVGRDLAGAQPLPAALPAFGVQAPNCYLLVDPLATTTSLSFPDGRASVTLQLPLTGALRGSEFFAQWVVFGGGANPAGVTTSNALSLVVQ